MRIALIVEGETERAFLPVLRRYLEVSLAGNMPMLKAVTQNGRIPKEEKLKRLVENLLSGAVPYDAVIALTGVYTSKTPATRDFTDATDAKRKMQEWAGNNPNFYPHAAQHDFEAWLLPYWTTIQGMAGHNKNAPTGQPEDVNHDKSPAYHIKEVFSLGKKRDYSKIRDAKIILEKNDLGAAIGQCPELKSFINTILTLCGHPPLP
jgi:hypothetical protein